MPPMPTRPELEVIANPGGGITLNGEDTAKLGIYIEELERGWK